MPLKKSFYLNRKNILERTLTYKFARILSILFVPPSFTILIFTYFALRFENELSQQILLILVVLSFGFFFHIIFFLYLRRKGKLADSDAMIKEERTLPYLIGIIFYIAGFFILLLNEINTVTLAFWFCYISNTFLILMINKYWKISAHLMGAAGPLAALFFVAGVPSLVFLFVLFFLGWARLKLNCHTFNQVAAGAVVGFTSTYIQMYLIINYFYAG
jgi:hypothetical protein